MKEIRAAMSPKLRQQLDRNDMRQLMQNGQFDQMMSTHSRTLQDAPGMGGGSGNGSGGGMMP